MRLLAFLYFCSVFYCVHSKNRPKALTESMGQEVIEIGAPINEFPQELEEEPSNESGEFNVNATTTIQPATKKEVKKVTSIESRRKLKDIDRIDGVKNDEDDSKIEKELAEIYKDTVDYKADIDDVTVITSQASVSVEDKFSSEIITKTENVTVSATSQASVDEEKSALRSRDGFRFQPNSDNKKEVERFRTSVDEIMCERSVTMRQIEKKADEEQSSSSRYSSDSVLMVVISLAAMFS